MVFIIWPKKNAAPICRGVFYPQVDMSKRSATSKFDTFRPSTDIVDVSHYFEEPLDETFVTLTDEEIESLESRTNDGSNCVQSADSD